MDFKLTEKAVKAEKPLAIGYCELWEAFHRFERIGYTYGQFGWKSDVYNIGHHCFSTGYNPVGNYPEHELLNQAKNAVNAIIADQSLDYKTQTEFIENVMITLYVTAICPSK